MKEIPDFFLSAKSEDKKDTKNRSYKSIFQHVPLPLLPVAFEKLELISSCLLCPQASLRCGTVLKQVFHCHLLFIRQGFSFCDDSSNLAFDTGKQFWIIVSHHHFWVSEGCSMSPQTLGEVAYCMSSLWFLWAFARTSRQFKKQHQPYGPVCSERRNENNMRAVRSHKWEKIAFLASKPCERSCLNAPVYSSYLIPLPGCSSLSV